MRGWTGTEEGARSKSSAVAALTLPLSLASINLFAEFIPRNERLLFLCISVDWNFNETN